MVAHGFLAALAFALNGYLYQQTGTLEFQKLGGLLKQLPFIGTAMLMAAFAGCGLPGFANFAGEVTVFFGSWKSFPLITTLACWGALVIGGVYMLRAVRSVLHGPLPANLTNIPDARWWRKLPFLVLLGALLVFGCFPSLLSGKIVASAEPILRAVEQAQAVRPVMNAALNSSTPQSLK